MSGEVQRLFQWGFCFGDVARTWGSGAGKVDRGVTDLPVAVRHATLQIPWINLEIGCQTRDGNNHPLPNRILSEELSIGAGFPQYAKAETRILSLWATKILTKYTQASKLRTFRSHILETCPRMGQLPEPALLKVGHSDQSSVSWTGSASPITF